MNITFKDVKGKKSNAYEDLYPVDLIMYLTDLNPHDLPYRSFNHELRRCYNKETQFFPNVSCGYNEIFAYVRISIPSYITKKILSCF